MKKGKWLCLESDISYEVNPVVWLASVISLNIQSSKILFFFTPNESRRHGQMCPCGGATQEHWSHVKQCWDTMKWEPDLLRLWDSNKQDIIEISADND